MSPGSPKIPFVRRYHNLTGIFNDDFECPDDDPVCNACFDPVTRKFSRITEWDKSVNFMNFGDWVSYSCSNSTHSFM